MQMITLTPLLIFLTAKQLNTTIPIFAKSDQLATKFLRCFLSGGDTAHNGNSSDQGSIQQYIVTEQATGMLPRCRCKSIQNQLPKPIVRSSLTLIKSH